MVQCGGVDFLRQFQPVAARLSEADDFFQPRRAGGLDVQPGTEARQRAADGRVDRKLVAAGVDAEFEIGEQTVALHRMGDDGEILIKLLLELRHVTDVVHALVKASRELRRDGLHRNLLVR